MANSTPTTTDEPTEAENIIEAILLLHSLAYDAATIAQRLHADQASVLHVLKYGELPARQLTLAWREVPK